jgi:hypothetical protein
MTLIAGFTLGRTPLLIGGVLTAQPAAASASTTTSSARASALLPEEYGPQLVIRQRLSLISDHLALAWSGPLPAASFVLKQLRRRAAAGAMSQAALDELLAEVDRDRHLSQLALIGLRLDKSGEPHMFGHGVERGEVGTPASAYFCEASAHGLFRAAMAGSIELFNDGNDLLRGMCAANAIANIFLAHTLDINKQIETRSANAMLALHSGGYETVVLDNGRLRKTPLFFALWRARNDGVRTQVEAPTIVVKRAYVGHTLLLRWSWTKRQGRRILLPLTQQQCLAVVGADYNALPLRLQQQHWPAFRSDTECHGILLFGGPGGGGMGTLTHRCPSELERDIRFDERPGLLATRARLSTNAPVRIFEAVSRLVPART